MQYRFLLIIIFWTFASLPILQAQEQDTQTVTATGMGTILSGDLAKARDDAIQDALRKAIEQAIGQMITSETVVENFMVLSDRIYSKVDGYVQKYRPVDEKNHPDAVEVTVEAVVLQRDLVQDLEGIALLLDGLKRPRIMVLIDEQILMSDPADSSVSSTSTNTTEATISDAFLAKGFDVVDYTTVQQNVERNQVLAAARGDATAATTLGQQYAAEVIVTGKAVATQAQLSGNLGKIMGTMKSYQANLTARAIRVDTGVLIAQATPIQRPAVHINPMNAGTIAIQNAAESLADELMKKILIRWQAERTGGAVITLIVHDVDYGQLLDFQNRIKLYIRGIKDVTERQYVNRVARLDVEFTGNGQALARELVTKDMETFTVKIISVSGARVEVEMMDR